MRVSKIKGTIAAGLLAFSLLPVGAGAAMATSAPVAESSEPAEPYINEFGIEIDPMNPFVDSSTSELTSQPPQTAEGETSALRVRIEVNPYGCEGHTERAHKSNRFMSLHARTDNCSSAVAEMTTSPEIMKLGFFGQWHSLGSNPSTKNNVKWMDANTKRVCASFDWQTYRGNGFHRVKIGSKSYIAQSSSDQETRYGCNAHAL